MARFARKYRERLAVQERQVSTNASGDTVEQWPTIYRRRAEIASVRGAEPVAAGGKQAITVYLVTLRSDRLTREITPRDRRFVWESSGNRILAIESAVPVGEQRREIKCSCVEEIGNTA